MNDAAPDLSALPPDLATDGLLAQLFTVRQSAPKPYEAELPDPERIETLPGGARLRHWGGTVDSGRSMLFVHGWEGRASQFALTAGPLIAQGARIAALDAPGHGLAKGLKSNPLEFSLAVQEACRAAPPFDALIGHSQGAVAAAHALLAGARAQRLVLIAPVISIEAHLRGLCALLGLSDETTALFLSKVEAEVGVPPQAFELARLAATREAPTLLIHDRQDREAPFAPVEALAAGWPGARLLTTEGLGHRRILGDPAVAAEARRFLLG